MELKYIEKNVIKQVYDKNILFVAKDDNVVFDFKNGNFSLILSSHKLLPLKASNYTSVVYAFKNTPNKKLERNINTFNRK